MAICELTYLQGHIGMGIALGLFVLTFHLVMRLSSERIGSVDNDIRDRRRARASTVAIGLLAGIVVMGVFLTLYRSALC